jgi:RNA polymerase sigma factor (sigma-70 family)
MATTMDNQQLIAECAAGRSEAAFAELVERYVDFVYSTALRLVGGNTQLAEDVTQTVFITLSRKILTLQREVTLGGWLHRHTYHVATKAVRGERRRQVREREAVEMNMLNNAEAHWQQVAPVLDEAIAQLGREDQSAILLRFFERRSFRAIGQALGGSEDAARMRVNRALDKLQGLLRHQGVTISVAALGAALTAQTVTAAPPGLASSISAVTHSAGGLSSGSLKLITMTKLKVGLVALSAVVAGVSLVILHQSQNGLRIQREQGTAQLPPDSQSLAPVAQQTEAPRLASAAAGASNKPPAALSESSEINRLYAQLLGNTPVTLTPAQVEPYLLANGRSAASLLAAFRTTGETGLLEEAMKQFPGDPQVAFEAALRKDSPEVDRRLWLDALKKSAPDNALGYYLSAADYFKSGQRGQAMQDLQAAAGKQQLNDYSAERLEDDSEAYRAADYPLAQANLVATTQLLFPQLVQLRELSANIVDLANSYRQAGDEASAQAALQMAVSLGQAYSQSSSHEPLIARLVGVAIERNALSAMPADSPWGDAGQTVQDRLNQLTQARNEVRELAGQAEALWPRMTEQDWISYQNRSSALGEEAAIRWLVARYGQN